MAHHERPVRVYSARALVCVVEGPAPLTADTCAGV